LSRGLIDEEIVSRFGDGPLKGLPDAASLELGSRRIVFSTDSFVVQPLLFPGGSIGHLAVHGTVNDIAVSGGKPAYLSLALILEEGLELDVLRRVLDDVRAAALEVGVKIVTGDTKVVSRGQCDGMYLNTAGIGTAIPGFELSPSRLEPGDVILASGTIGDHGMAVMAAREGLAVGQGLVSDTAPVIRLVEAAEPWAKDVHFMRDPTRGGLASVLNEAVEGRAVGVLLRETLIPYRREAAALSEVLGIDLLHVACEGRMLLLCRRSCSEQILSAWRALPQGQNAAIIGEVTKDAGRVVLETAIGGKRLVDVPQGELLPRIC
jgi:hydrogenase expression/formation protein HypE